MQNVECVSLFSSFKVTNSGLKIVAGELQNVRQGACAAQARGTPNTLYFPH